MATAAATFPGGEILEIEEIPSEVDWVLARPDRYEELERTLVPAEHCDALWYGGYILVIDLTSLVADFELTSAAT